jgi:hypothetical protein
LDRPAYEYLGSHPLSFSIRVPYRCPDPHFYSHNESHSTPDLTSLLIHASSQSSDLRSLIPGPFYFHYYPGSFFNTYVTFSLYTADLHGIARDTLLSHMTLVALLRISFLHQASQLLSPYTRPGSDDLVLARVRPSFRCLFQLWLYFHPQHLSFLIAPQLLFTIGRPISRHLGSLIQDHTTMLRRFLVVPYPSSLASQQWTVK